jgi:hypothetical protein
LIAVTLSTPSSESRKLKRKATSTPASFLLGEHCREQQVKLRVLKPFDPLARSVGRTCLGKKSAGAAPVAGGEPAGGLSNGEGFRVDAMENRFGVVDRVRPLPIRRS